jgi:hypothetical protein
MMNTKFFLAVLVSSVLAYFGGWLIFGIGLNNFYSMNTNEAAKVLMKTPLNLVGMAISVIAQSVLITWVLQQTNNTNAMRGFTTSLWVALLTTLSFDLSLYASWNVYNEQLLVVDIFTTTIFWGIIGAISGAILGSGSRVDVNIPTS